jgi:hypothetical protein
MPKSGGKEKERKNNVYQPHSNKIHQSYRNGIEGNELDIMIPSVLPDLT